MKISTGLMVACAMGMGLLANTASADITATIANLTVTGAGASVSGSVVTADFDSTATIDFDIFLTKDDASNVGSLGISVFGYDLGAVGSTGDLIAFVTGSAGSASSPLFLAANLDGAYQPNPIGSPTGPNHINGVPNLQLVPAEISIAAAPFELNIANVFNTNTAAGVGDGTIDGGVDGLVGGAQVHVQFQLTGILVSGSSSDPLNVGLGNGDGFTDVAGVTGTVIGDLITITVVPEPASLLSGLAALATVGFIGLGRRRTR